MVGVNRDAKRLRIFIVEDHRDTLECFTLYLEGRGHEVLSAISVREALGKLPRVPCDLLLSDIRLPDGTGWELMQGLGLSRPDFAVAMSGYGTSFDEGRSVKVGFRRHLVKPIEPEVLDELLAEAARKAAARN